MFAWMPFLAADLGCIFGGRSAWCFRSAAWACINARRCAFTLGAILMTRCRFVGFVESPYAAIALISLAGFAHQTLSVTVITMASDLFRRNEVATVAGMAGTCGNAGVLVFIAAARRRWSTTVGYTPFFVGLGVLDLVGAAVLWTVVAANLPPPECQHPLPSSGSKAEESTMATIRNPILRGFNPDPSIVRVGDDYYIATSTFEWYPGRADPPFARSRALAPADAPAHAAPASSTCAAIPIRAASGRRA